MRLTARGIMVKNIFTAALFVTTFWVFTWWGLGPTVQFLSRWAGGE